MFSFLLLLTPIHLIWSQMDATFGSESISRSNRNQGLNPALYFERWTASREQAHINWRNTQQMLELWTLCRQCLLGPVTYESDHRQHTDRNVRPAVWTKITLKMNYSQPKIFRRLLRCHRGNPARARKMPKRVSRLKRAPESNIIIKIVRHAYKRIVRHNVRTDSARRHSNANHQINFQIY